MPYTFILFCRLSFSIPAVAPLANPSHGAITALTPRLAVKADLVWSVTCATVSGFTTPKVATVLMPGFSLIKACQTASRLSGD